MSKTFVTKLSWLLFSLAFVFYGCVTTPTEVTDPAEDPCVETRAALDVGSGATRIKVAKVDFCQMRIKEVLFEKQEKFPYQESLQKSADKSFSPEVIAEGAAVARRLHAESMVYKPRRVLATVAAAFREAKNGESAAFELAKLANVPVRMLDQDLEGRLGFLGAAQQVNTPLTQIAVWDIGAGSQQITLRKETGEMEVFKSSLASETFKDHLIRVVQKKSAKSPNPISRSHEKAAHKFLVNQLKNVPSDWKAFIQDPKTEVIGIGGVHYYSVRGQVGTHLYTETLLAETLAKRLNLTDEQIGGDFASTEVSNLILVRAMMEGLGVRRVQAVNVNLSDGAMVYPEFWK